MLDTVVKNYSSEGINGEPIDFDEAYGFDTINLIKNPRALSTYEFFGKDFEEEEIDENIRNTSIKNIKAFYEKALRKSFPYSNSNLKSYVNKSINQKNNFLKDSSSYSSGFKKTMLKGYIKDLKNVLIEIRKEKENFDIYSSIDIVKLLDNNFGKNNWECQDDYLTIRYPKIKVQNESFDYTILHNAFIVIDLNRLYDHENFNRCSGIFVANPTIFQHKVRYQHSHYNVYDEEEARFSYYVFTENYPNSEEYEDDYYIDIMKNIDSGYSNNDPDITNGSIVNTSQCWGSISFIGNFVNKFLYLINIMNTFISTESLTGGPYIKISNIDEGFNFKQLMQVTSENIKNVKKTINIENDFQYDINFDIEFEDINIESKKINILKEVPYLNFHICPNAHISFNNKIYEYNPLIPEEKYIFTKGTLDINYAKLSIENLIRHRLNKKILKKIDE